MLERLGHVLGWTGNCIAVLLILAGIYHQFFVRTVSVPFPYIPYALEPEYLPQTFFEIVTIVVAPLVFLVGRAFRYIFAGPTKR